MIKTLGHSFQSHFQHCIKKNERKRRQSTTTTINEVCNLIPGITWRLNEAEKWISGEAEIKVWKDAYLPGDEKTNNFKRSRNLDRKLIKVTFRHLK